MAEKGKVENKKVRFILGREMSKEEAFEKIKKACEDAGIQVDTETKEKD